jgi:hypothetical protein
MTQGYRGLQLLACVALMLHLTCGPSLAQAKGSASPQAATDGQVRELLDLALRNISRARCDNEKPCKPATEDELRSPPVSMEEARRAAQTGVLSALAEKCGDPDQKFFRAMMAHFRQSVRLNERQLALLALVHGIQLGSFTKILPANACTPQIRELLSKGS